MRLLLMASIPLAAFFFGVYAGPLWRAGLGADMAPAALLVGALGLYGWCWAVAAALVIGLRALGRRVVKRAPSAEVDAAL